MVGGKSRQLCRANKKLDTLDLRPAPYLGCAGQRIAGASGNNAMNMDITEHRKTYDMFTSLTKWSMIGLVALLVLMAIFLL